MMGRKRGWEGGMGKARLPGQAGLREVQLTSRSETHEQMWGRKELGVQGTRRGLLRKQLCARKQLGTRLEGRARREGYTQG